MVVVVVVVAVVCVCVCMCACVGWDGVAQCGRRGLSIVEMLTNR